MSPATAPMLAPGAMRIALHAPPGAVVALAVPPPLCGLCVARLRTHDLQLLGHATSDFAPQAAVIARVSGAQPSATLVFEACDQIFDGRSNDWPWNPPSVALNTPSEALRHYVAGLVDGLPQAARIDAVMRHVTGVFHYGHGGQRFTDGHAAVPVLSCGTTRGSCVDIHTYAVAALRAAGVPAAYVAGVFWRRGQRETGSMHCWVVVGGQTSAVWDLSHDLMAQRIATPDLQAIPGRRFPLSSGRGLQFVWEAGSFELSHFALPYLIECADDPTLKLQSSVELIDDDGGGCEDWHDVQLELARQG